MERVSDYVTDPVLSDYDFIKNPDRKALHCLRLFDSKVRPEMGFVIGSYLMMHMDLFHDPNEIGISEEERKQRRLVLDMRGIIFDRKSGRCIRRPWEKFFNIGECMAKSNLIDWNDALALEKLDGSMLCPVVLSEDDVIWMTKKSSNPDVDQFVKENPSYNKMVTSFPGWSCIFEWCSPNNRVVVPYEKSQLILTGMRNISLGTYKPYEELKEIATNFNVPCVKVFDLQPEDGWKTYLPKIYSLEKLEGCVVISKTTGKPLCKLKCNWYVNIHKACSEIRDSTVIPWQCVINETLDDVLPRLSEDLVNQMQNFNKAVIEGMEEKSRSILSHVKMMWEKSNRDEKEFSKFVISDDVDKDLRPLYFMIRREMVKDKSENYDAFDEVHSFLKKNVSKIAFLENFTGVSLSKFKK